MRPNNTGLKRAIYILLFSLGVGFIFYFLGPILMPFAAGALLAYLTNPIVNYLINSGLSRIIAVILVFVTLFAVLLLLLLLLIPLIQQQFFTLTVFIPDTILWAQSKVLPWLMQHFGVETSAEIATFKKLLSENIFKAGNIATWLIQTTLQSGRALFHVLTNLILIPVVTFYLLRDWHVLLANSKQMIPRKLRPTVIHLAHECDLVLSGFFRGQLLVMLALGFIYSVGLTIIGLKIGIIIGLIAGLLTLVPYLGTIIGFAIAIIAALVQFGTLSSLIWVALVFIIGQTLEGMFLTPTFIGNRIGMHPVAVLFAVLAGGALLGFFGVLVALPVAAIIMVLLRHLNRHYHKSQIYQET